jgi:hypothetical protein
VLGCCCRERAGFQSSRLHLECGSRHCASDFSKSAKCSEMQRNERNKEKTQTHSPRSVIYHRQLTLYDLHTACLITRSVVSQHLNDSCVGAAIVGLRCGHWGGDVSCGAPWDCQRQRRAVSGKVRGILAPELRDRGAVECGDSRLQRFGM